MWLAVKVADRGEGAVVDSFYEALRSGNVEVIRSTFAEDAVLTFGPFRFEGREEIVLWAVELKKHFPYLGCSKIGTRTKDDEIFHRFTLRVIGPNRVKGKLQCIGRYLVRDSKIHRALIRGSDGVLEITDGDVKRLTLI